MKLLKLEELVDGWVYWAREKEGGYQLVEVYRYDNGHIDLYKFASEAKIEYLDEIEGFVAENVRAPDGQCYSNPWKDGPDAEAQPGSPAGEQ